MINASSPTDDGRDDTDLFIDADFYNAATNGDFEMFNNYTQPLDRLLSQNKNTILHVHLKSQGERSKEFVEKVLAQCPQLLWKTNNDGAIPLHIAATHGHLDIVNLFIEEAKKHRDSETGEEEADSIRRMLRKTNKQKETALHLATRDCWLDVVQEILKHEDRNYTYTANESGETPLYLAITYNSKAATAILNKFESPDCGGPNGTTTFHAAACGSLYGDAVGGWLDLMLSKVGSFVNQADESGWNPLHYAAYFDNSDIARRILRTDKRSAYATEKDRCRTALHIASCRGSVDTMKQIIDKCPECCEITDVRGWNVLHYAVLDKSQKSVKAIVKNPSLMYLLNEPDIKGYTPHQLLRKSDHSGPLIHWIIFKADVPLKFLPKKSIRTTFSDVDEDREKKKIQKWMKDLGGGPLGKTFDLKKDWNEFQIEREEKIIPELEKAKESHLVAAALVATVTFAAAFTLPGGYISDENNSKLQGTPILSRNAAFKAFVVTDAIAMVLSTSSVFIYFLMAMLGYKRRYYWLIRSALWFVVLAMGAMVVAFVTGTYVVLAPSSKGLAIATCVIGLSFFLHVAYATIRLIVDFVKRDRVEYCDSPTIESICRFFSM